MDWVPLLGAFGVGGLLVNMVTQFVTGRRDKTARKLTFRKQQLEQFYGPLLAAHKEIRARRELSVKLQQAIDSRHVGDMLTAGPAGPEKVRAVSDAYLPAIEKNIEDENQSFREVTMPRYREMISTFRDKMWLADPATRKFFPELVEFVDVWDKILAGKLPPAVVPVIGHTEKNLKSFYEHLEEMHDRLRTEIS